MTNYEFLDNAIHGNGSEVLLGQPAATNASRGDVKSFGQMLVDDHLKARVETSGLVQQMGMVATTSADSQAAEEWETLRQLKGEAFDTEFVRCMIDDHRKDIEAFRREASARPGPAKDFASRSLPTLLKHLDMAESLASRQAKGPQQAVVVAAMRCQRAACHLSHRRHRRGAEPDEGSESSRPRSDMNSGQEIDASSIKNIRHHQRVL